MEKKMNLFELIDTIRNYKFVSSVELTNCNLRNGYNYIRVVCDIELPTIREFKDFVTMLRLTLVGYEVRDNIDNGTINIG